MTDFRDRAMAALRYDPESGHFFWRVDIGRVRSGDRAGAIDQESGYVRIGFDGRDYYAHRLAVLFVTGDWPPKGTEPDHRNGKRHENWWGNLRCITRSRNNLNAGLSTRNKSGVVGISWDRSREKWAAEMKVDGKRLRLGRFSSKDDAITARRTAEARFGITHAPHRDLPGRARLR